MNTVKRFINALSTNLILGPTVRQPKEDVVAASTANVSFVTGLEPGDSVDGVVLKAGDRVLLKNQTNGTQNGIWLVIGVGSAGIRTTDMDESADFNGALVRVSGGTTNGGKTFVCTATAFNLGVDTATFSEAASSLIVNGTSNKGFAVVQTSFGAAATWTLKVYGRIAGEAPWALLATITDASTFGANSTRLDPIVAYPEITVDLTVAAGSPAVSCWVDVT